MFLVERRDNLGVPPMPRRREKGSQFALHNAVIFYSVVKDYPLGSSPTTLYKATPSYGPDAAYPVF